MTITLNGTTLTNSGFGAVLTNVGEGYLTNAATLTNEHRAYLINIGVGTTLTNEGASTLTNTGATLLNTGGATLTNTGAGTELYNLGPPSHGATLTNTGVGTVLINEDGASLINGANSTIDNQDSATLINSANVLNNGTINNSASFEDTATGTVLGTGSFIQTAGGVTEIDGYFMQGALNVEAGTFTVNNTTVITGNASDAGSITITANNMLTVGHTFTVTGNLTIDSGATLAARNLVENGGVITLDGGTIDPTGIAAYGGTISGSGALIGNVVNDAEMTASGGSLDIQGNVTGGGTLVVGSGATLELEGSVGDGNTLQFAADTGVAQIGDLLNSSDQQQFNAPISDFVPGDGIALALDGLGTFDDISAATPGTYDALTNTTALALDDGASLVATLTMEGDYAGRTFTVSQASGFADVGMACYCPGTLIQTERGQKRVEDLKIGDEVMTMSGALRPIKWIGRRRYGGRFVMGRKDILPICIKAGALDDNVPRRDLWISPHHAMYFKDKRLEGVLIEAKDLVNGASIVLVERVDKVEYFHIELDTHDVIIAEGALSESYIDDDSRGIFHNADEYRALYPETVTGIAQYCAPRLEDGYEVEAVRQRIALRAGLVLAEKRIGHLRGHLNRVTNNCIAGWAQNTDHPEAPVCLDIYAGGQLIGQVLANRYREDLARAAIGSGCHGFEFIPPAGLTFAPDAVDVRRSLDGVPLAPTITSMDAEPHPRAMRA